jgi:oligopeptide transport system substrate-binding protein
MRDRADLIGRTRLVIAAMAIRTLMLATLAACTILTGSCDRPGRGPIKVSAIGGPPRLANPNLDPIDPPSAMLIEVVAQGLVRFDAAGEIEPALAQSWIVSDDGRRYTFRLRRSQWTGGDPVTAQQVVTRLRATLSRQSRNQLKPVLGAIDEIVAMTDRVLEISLRGARPNLLQLLAHPDMAIIDNGRGTGPYQMRGAGPASVALSLPLTEDETEPASPDILLTGERGARAVARFADGDAELVTGGTAGDLAYVRAANLPANRLVFDPVAGLFGLVFTGNRGPLTDPDVRRALSMAVDRQQLAGALGVPQLAPRTSLTPPGLNELPTPINPDWAGAALDGRRQAAIALLAPLGANAKFSVRVAIPDGPGYALAFAHLRRDWRLIGVEAVRVAGDAPADLRLIDRVAPADLASWYLRHFTCEISPVCDPAADAALEAARTAPTPAERGAQFVIAERLLTEATPFIPLTAPVRWSLVAPRLTGFRPNPFARHHAAELIAERP